MGYLLEHFLGKGRCTGGSGLAGTCYYLFTEYPVAA